VRTNQGQVAAVELGFPTPSDTCPRTLAILKHSTSTMSVTNNSTIHFSKDVSINLLTLFFGRACKGVTFPSRPIFSRIVLKQEKKETLMKNIKTGVQS